MFKVTELVIKNAYFLLISIFLDNSIIVFEFLRVFHIMLL